MVNRLLIVACLCASSLSAAAVEQAELVWKKPVDAHTLGIDRVQGPFFLPGGRIALVSDHRNPGDGTTQIVTTIFNPDSTILRTMLIGTAESGSATLGGASVDRAGSIYVAARMEKDRSVHLVRYTAAGDEAENRTLSAEAGMIPTSLLVERSGDIFIGGQSQNLGQGFAARTNSAGDSGWRYSDAWKPTKIASDQRGAVVLAGPTASGPLRVAKVDRDGKRVFSVELQDTTEIAGLAFDPDGKVVVLARSAAGGTLLYSLDAADGHSVWIETKLNTPEIQPKDLIVDSRRFIYILVDSKEEGVVRSYAVRYSLGGTPLENLKPTSDGSHGGSIWLDSVGEFYVSAVSARGQVIVSRAASNLNTRYVLRSASTDFDCARIAVRDEDGAIAVVAMKKDEQGGLFQPVVFRGRQAPVAKYDTYKAIANSQNNLSTVLANDQYLEGAQMSITQRPSKGKLEMQADGSFLYTPISGFTGKDTFRYQLSRGALTWYAAVVTLNVE